VLDVVGAAIDDALIVAWRGRALRAGARLGWTVRQAIARRHAGGVLLAITAPLDLLLLATEVNEWALCASLVERDPLQWSGLEEALVAAAAAAAEDGASPPLELIPVIEESAAFARFERLAAVEGSPVLRALIEAAASRGLRLVLDDSELTVGTGTGGRSFPLAALPAAADVRWSELRDIPTALVTGSNGKTTTVRLLAACARANGWQAAYNCTDGVFIDDEVLATGDYSGPAGARMVLRERRTQAAIIETARGGILRRGIAVSQADVAVVTNVSSDHFGEYGIDDLAGLADAKLSVAAVVAPQGMLVLNADDPQLRARAGGLARRFGRCPPLGWFALDADQATLSDAQADGASTCAVRNGRLLLSHQGREHDLGLVSAMPLTIGGIAAYNVANLAAAALSAAALGIPAAAISSVFARFGARPTDNPGRMMRFDVAGARVLIDYAHNPDGLRGLLSVAEHLRAGTGRLCLLLGHAGNRQDADIEELARVAAGFRPDLVVVKENDAQLRGRAPGEVPRILRNTLKRSGLPESALPVCASEVAAARYALDWARPRDVLVFPLHSQTARAAVVAMLESMRSGKR
jgi:UDP-N-acetylmuramyl tripeptide synthase